MTIIAVLIVVVTVLLLLSYRGQKHQMQEAIKKQRTILALALNDKELTMWTYDTTTGLFKWREKTETRQREHTPAEFAKRYRHEVHQHINGVMQQLIRGEIKERFFDYTVKVTDGTKHRYTMAMSVIRHDKNGEVQVIAAFQRDVTELHRGKESDKETRLRYQAFFNTAMVDMVYYNSRGEVREMNHRACETFKTTNERAKQMGLNIKMALKEDSINPRHFEPFHATQRRTTITHDSKTCNQEGHQYYEIQLLPIYGSRGQLECAYGSGRDVTEIAMAYHNLHIRINSLQQANKALTNYIRDIDYAMKTGGIRTTEYSPDSQLLTIYRETNRIQMQLNKERILSLIDEQSAKAVSQILDNMDRRMRTPYNSHIKTVLYNKDKRPLYLHVNFVPISDEQGHLTHYFGMLRDISELKWMELQLANETIRARQLETAKNAFMRNMSYEIRTPLNAVVGFSELFQQEHTLDDEHVFVREIKENASRLLSLINSILFLSRLDAGMIESKKIAVDFATVFPYHCEAGWGDYRQEGVDYLTESSFEELQLEVDNSNLGIIIGQLCRNAAENTHQGHVKASYDYADGQLVISVEDTGTGISPEMQRNIFERFAANNSQNPGLGMPICKELATKLGGDIQVYSHLGQGTVVRVTIPCEATVTKRK